ncbi:hypothetical protein Tco_0682914 [Tanacetum coccineum]|uniref:Reverse transcriptase zinc-binding domain-containing protein n=1 Tax=Tanacetum coccineum TaxID=301880 RepID=A0ABQ4XSI9_9ASTR
MKKAFQDMLHGLGEVNPTHAYYNGSCTSKDTEDTSWRTSFKTMRTLKTSSALEDFIYVVFVLDRNIVRSIKAIHGLETGFDGKGCYTKGIWEQIMGSFNYLHSRNILSKGEDGVFSISATRLHIDHTILSSSNIETRWNKGLPRMVNIFIWRLHLDRLPTQLNLSK